MGAVNAVVLCPGESLSPALTALHNGGVDPSFTIGVNRAVEAFPCDYWCSLDAAPYRNTTPKGRPKYIIRHDQNRKLGDDAPDLERAQIIKPRMEGYPRSVNFNNFSMLTAIAFAAANGATEIDIYGSDWSGTDDWDGVKHPQPQRRNETRWKKEARRYNELKRYYAEKGIKVRRRWKDKDPVHFIWYGPEMPKWAVRNINRFVEMNPRREIYLHGEEVLLDKYAEHAKKINSDYKSGLGNLLRLSALQRYGGWYFDVDFWPLRPLEEAERKFELDGRKLFCAHQRKNGDINNAFLHASKDSPVWADVDAVLDGLKTPYKRPILGPKLLTRTAKQSKNNVHVIGHEWFYPLWVKSAGKEYNRIIKGGDAEKLKQCNAETDGEMPFAIHLWADQFGGQLI